MTDHDRLIDTYLAAWNETDPGRRQGLIAESFTTDASYRDPKLAADGHAQIDAMLVAVQGMFPGHRMRRLPGLDAHNDRLRFRWALETPEGATVVAGTDVALVARDGRLCEVTGFFDA